MFLWRAEDLGIQPSVVADVIHPFNFEGLLDGSDGANASDDPWLLYHDTKNMDAAAIADCAGSQSSLHVTMAAVSLHITREVALQSGLLGLLDDAPVQMVDVGDEARLRAFQGLFKEHALEREPAVQTLFETFSSCQFQMALKKWKREAEWTIFAYMWQSARRENLDILGTKPGSSWLPHLNERESIRMSQYLPNEKHPWVKKAIQSAPKLKPRIMVQYCTSQCYIKERLPEYFASY